MQAVSSIEYHDTPIYYNKIRINHFIPIGANCRYLKVPKVEQLEDLPRVFNKAINSPLNTLSLRELVLKYYKTGEKIVILVDDHTRPNLHTPIILPLLLEKLVSFGVKEQDVYLFIATGSHPPPTDELIRERILGDQFEDWKDRIWLHDCDVDEMHQDLGLSELKTPIKIDKRVLSASACIRIALSDSEYHYFAGISGSVKFFVPGSAARKTIRFNHSRIFDPNTGFKPACRMANIKGNVCIQDIRNMVEIIKEEHPIFVIDAITHMGEIVNIFAGDIIAIHNNAVQQLRSIRDVSISEKADLVIVTKPSVNFYQAGKGYDAASHAVKEGGSIVILAACPDGFGPQDYLDTVNEVRDKPYLEAMRWIIENRCSEDTFEVGIQNAVELFKILEMTNGSLYVYSELDKTVLEKSFRVKTLKKRKNVQETLREFVLSYLKHHPDNLIYVFEDYNILSKLS